MNNLLVIIDNGHGADTPGKCSPDGRYREWAWTRKLANRIAQQLKTHGIECHILVPEDADIPLAQRVGRVKKLARRSECILVSLHSNAAGNGAAWQAASGWSVFVDPRAGKESRRLAQALYNQAAKAGILGNRAPSAQGYNTASLAMCRDTPCPAVLTENMFHDNARDVDFLLSEEGLECIAEVHLKGILNFATQ